MKNSTVKPNSEIDQRIKGKAFDSCLELKNYLNELGYEVTIIEKRQFRYGKNHKVIDYLPKEMRQELDEKIVSRQFFSYEELASWLTENGYSIARSSVARYGKNLQDQYDKVSVAILHAKTLAENVKDDAGDLPEMIQTVMQSEVLYNLIEQKYSTEDLSLTDLLRAGSSVVNTSINVKKYKQQIKSQAKTVAETVENACKDEAALTSDKIDWIKEQILGIVQ